MGGTYLRVSCLEAIISPTVFVIFSKGGSALCVSVCEGGIEHCLEGMVIIVYNYPLFLVGVFRISDPTTGRCTDLLGFEFALLWQLQD